MKKLLAVVTTALLALGLVAVTAGPASAHHNTINPVVTCNDDFTWTITWSVSNSEDRTETITGSTDTNLVPIGTVFTNLETKKFTEVVTGPVNKTLTLDAKWDNNVTNTNAGSVKKSDFGSGCTPPQHIPVTLCHATPPDTAAEGWHGITVDDDAVVTSGHNGQHGADIIPAFYYWVHNNVTDLWEHLYFPGKNLGTTYFGFTGQQIVDAGCATPPVTATTPTFADSICTGPGTSSQATYTIPSANGVKYQVSIGAGAWADVAAGTYNAASPSTVHVRALALDNYTLTGTTTWDHSFVSAGACIVTVEPASAAFADSICTAPGVASQATYTIPTSAGVKYQVKVDGGSWTDVAAGVYDTASPSSVQVQALALAGYALTGTASWSHSFVSAGECLVDVQPAAATFADSICTAPGVASQATYTIPSTDHVTYQVKIGAADWADVAAGQYNADSPSSVQVRAIPAPGYSLTGTTTWTHDFVSAGECLVDAQPAAATFADSICTAPGVASQGTYTIPSTDHVTYQVKIGDGDWADVAAGQYNADSPSSVHVRAIPEGGYSLTGTTTWDHDYASPGDCLVLSAPADPTFADGVCTAPGVLGDSTYTIGSADHISYQVKINGGAFAPVAAGQYTAPAGSTVTIKAIADAGYSVLGTSEWSHAFPATSACDVTTTPVAPGVTAQSCEVQLDQKSQLVSGFITIPTTTGVIYSIEGNVTAAGDHDFAPGTYSVSAAPALGYVLTGYTGPWPTTILPDLFCGDLITHPLVTPAAVTSKAPTCSSDGSYTIPTTEGVTYSIGGNPVAAGVYQVKGAQSITVTAAANAPDYGLEDGVTTSWPLDFPQRPTDCLTELTTLALTGTTSMVGLGAAFGFILIGAAGIFVRRRLVTEK